VKLAPSVLPRLNLGQAAIGAQFIVQVRQEGFTARPIVFYLFHGPHHNQARVIKCLSVNP